MSENEKIAEDMEDVEARAAYERISPEGGICLHEARMEILPTPGIDGMSIKIFGHNVREADSESEMAHLIMSAPMAAVMAHDILKAIDGADPVTKIMCSVALATREAGMEATDGERGVIVAAPEGESALTELFEELAEAGVLKIMKGDVPDDEEPKSDDKPRGARGVNPADEPLNIRYFGNGRATFAPVDNRGDFPDDMGGYL